MGETAEFSIDVAFGWQAPIIPGARGYPPCGRRQCSGRGTILVLLWPPTSVYWEGVAAVLGETPTLAGVVLIAAGAGAWFARTSGLGLLPIVLGTGAAYATGMLWFVVWVGPGSPAHFLWYGVLAGALVCGALLWWVAVQLSR